jgi:ABC-type multidrug transport system fused ATPase/permease subunit
VFHDELPEALKGAVEFFEPDRYNAATNLQDNILFGKIAYGQAQAQERVGGLIREVVDELGLRNAVSEVGFGFQVGVAGSRLSGQQRQKLALARAILKRPDILVLVEATAALDTASQARIMDKLLAEFEGRALIWVVHRIDMAPRFDLVLVTRQGRVVEQGAPAELDREGTTYRQLASAG